MKEITNEQYNMLENEAKIAAASIAEGKDTQTILAEIYTNNLEGKDMEQGLAVAEAVLNTVSEFDDAMEQITENKEVFIEDFINKMDEQKTQAERCTYWLRFNSALVALSCDDPEERKVHLENAQSLTISDSEASAELETELKTNAKEALMNNTVLLENLENFGEGLEQVAKIDDTVQVITKLSESKVDLRAIMSMILYTKIMNGEIEDAPEDITVEQVVAAVCAETKEAEILEKLSAGEIAKDVAVFLLSLVGTVFTMLTLLKAFTLGAAGLACLIAGNSFVFVPLFLGLAVCGLFFLYKHTDAIIKNVVEVATITIDVAVSAVKFIAKTAAAVVRKSVEIVAFVGKKTIGLVKRLFGRGEVRQNATVTV